MEFLSKFSFLDCLLIIYRHVNNICVLMLYSATFFQFVHYSKSCICGFLKFYIYKILSSKNKGDLTSITIQMPFIYLSCLNVQAINSNTILKCKSVFFLIVREKLQFFTFANYVRCGLLIKNLYHVEKVPFSLLNLIQFQFIDCQPVLVY